MTDPASTKDLKDYGIYRSKGGNDGDIYENLLKDLEAHPMTPVDLNLESLLTDSPKHYLTHPSIRGRLVQRIKWPLEKHLYINIQRPLTRNLTHETS